MPPACFLQPYIWLFAKDHVIHDSIKENAPAIADPPQRLHLSKTVVLVGMMGAGKTAVGRALAARLSVPFRDSDAEIEAAANMSVPEIFARDGEPFFRRKEAQVIARLLRPPPGVLSTGGGAFLSEANRRLISDHAVSVCLRADLDVLWARVRHKTTRPLLRTPDPYATLEQLYRARSPIYAQADLTVVSDGQSSIETMVDRVLQALASRRDVLQVG